MQLYGIPKFKEKDCMSFLALVAKATGKLKKRGIPHTDAAARAVLHDWNMGKIKYYCMPPKSKGVGERTAQDMALDKDAKIVDVFAREYSVAGLNEADIRVMDTLQEDAGEEDLVGFVPVQSVD